MDKTYRNQYIGKEVYYAELRFIKAKLSSAYPWIYADFDACESDSVFVFLVVHSKVVEAVYG